VHCGVTHGAGGGGRQGRPGGRQAKSTAADEEEDTQPRTTSREKDRASVGSSAEKSCSVASESMTRPSQARARAKFPKK
jgi:hypothetical protein